MVKDNNNDASLEPIEKEVVFGASSATDFEPISTEPTITIGGTAYRWVTQLSINNEKFGSPEGKAAKENLIVQKGEYIKSVQSAHLYGGYNFITSIKLVTNRGKTWVLEGAEAPSKTREKFASLDLKDVRVLSIGGSYGGLGNSLKQLQIRYLSNYFVEDEIVDIGNETLYGFLDVSPPGKIEYYESVEARELESITAISEFAAKIETEIKQTYLLAEATARLGFSYMNRQELRNETEKVQKASTTKTVKIGPDHLGIGYCELEVKKVKGENGGYIIYPRAGKDIFTFSREEIKGKKFFDFNSGLQLVMPELKFTNKFGLNNFHEAE